MTQLSHPHMTQSAKTPTRKRSTWRDAPGNKPARGHVDDATARPLRPSDYFVYKTGSDPFTEALRAAYEAELARRGGVR
jgi:hypothetical protein